MLSARVNIFQEFYFAADLLPFGLSITTCIILLSLISLDICCKNSFTARPPFETGLLFTLSLFWLAFNVFSTFRWRYIPLDCSSIPSDYLDERAWCRDVQALKSFIWSLFVGLLFTAAFILRYAVLQAKRGNRKVWITPLSRYDPRKAVQPTHNRAMSRFTIANFAERSFMSWEEEKM